MRNASRFVFFCLTVVMATTGAYSATPAPLTVTVDGIADSKRIPDTNVICLATQDGKSDRTGKNLRPSIHWSGAPASTKSFAIFVMDPDVPADFADADKEGKTVAVDAKRQNFFHYAVLNIPAGTTSFAGGTSEVKPAIGTQLPNNVGMNKYVATPEQFGGPCPPWNDERLHHYHFIVLALDAPTNATKAPISGDTAKDAYERLSSSTHVIAKGDVVGTYSLNAKMK